MHTNRDNDGHIISVQELLDDASKRSGAKYDGPAPPDQKEPPVKELN